MKSREKKTPCDSRAASGAVAPVPDSSTGDGAAMSANLGARSSVQNGAANDRPWRAYSERLPSVESARIPPQFGGEFFLRQKIFKNRLRERHGDLRSVVSRAEDDMQKGEIKGARESRY